ncbi:SIR2 family protein [Bacillus sp. OR-18]|uniref:SIR2 family NAD-dependent protein deacylase n=1 Tax=Bacillus sp. OR-18 TaxID=3029191 RepID=UPI00259D3A4F|nr:SIR2 family protein [Bacillus sp. OR-18]MDM5040964.1 SIR2 family protein [Bacillus sp. OR-18]
MSDKTYLPDQHHIEKIRESLWCGREYGNVSIMVGAGFSLNAEKLSYNSDSFLLWNQLGEKMKSELHPYNSSYNQDVLKLASEYEEVFGRQALDQLIINSLPDDNYVPGSLHKMLLSLPWADIYTTNYDTLLERTTKYIYDRNYSLVLNTSDVPNRMKPRIVKLHGSFPSHRPFIFTEEDYRTYPKKYAPFVNMVQQTIMENVLCLIGFSGDDPNFLNWIGWVRDNLGENTPPIYFCGFVSSTQRRMLEARGITPIDFSPLFPEHKYPGVLKHKKALEWFLLSLKCGKKADVLRWPIIEKMEYDMREDIPYIPIKNYKIEPIRIDFGYGEEIKEEELLEIAKNWRCTRLLHPGWVITPRSNRQNLWFETERVIDEILHNIHKLTEIDSLMLIYELNWRIETSLSPLDSRWKNKIIAIIEKFNKIFQTDYLYRDAEQLKNFKSKLNVNIDWEYLHKCWIELIFSIIREARINHNIKEFNKWLSTIEGSVQINSEWVSRWYYEQALFHLFKLDQEGVKRILKEWPKNKNAPFWEVKRASILAELGEISEAERNCEEALEEIRIRLQANKIDLSLLSQEGWTMHLLRMIKRDGNMHLKDLGEYHDRWTKLSQYKCSPFQEIEIMDSLLKDSNPNLKKAVNEDFDPGITTYHFYYGANNEKILLSFEFLRLFEEVAMPKRCQSIAVFNKSVINATKWIKFVAPQLSISALIRTGDSTEIKNIFTRTYIASLDEQTVEYFYELFVPALKQALKGVSQGEDIYGFSHRHLPNLLEITSRLYFRFSKEKREKIFNLMIKMYNLKEIQNYHVLHLPLKLMFKRVLYGMQDKEICQQLKILLELPVIGEENLDIRMRSTWFEPFTFIEWGENYEGYGPNVNWGQAITRLIKLVRDSPEFTRDLALLRLSKLFKISGLTEEQCKEFAEALYNNIDNKTGLPKTSIMYNSNFLYLPKSDKEQVQRDYYNWIMEQNMPSLFVQDGVYSGAQEYSKFLGEWINSANSILLDKIDPEAINYSEEDCMKLLKKILVWWESERKSNFLSEDMFQGAPINNIYNLTHLMIQVIFPKLKVIDNIAKEKIRTLFEEFEDRGIIISHVLPATLHLDIYKEDYIYRKLKKEMNSNDEEKIKYSSNGCLFWIIYNKKGIVSKEIPVKLINNWVNKVYSRRQPELNQILNDIGTCLLYYPNILDSMNWDYVLEGLEYLLKETDINVIMQEEKYQLFTGVEYANYKQLCVRLAGISYKSFKEIGKDIPDILIKWRDICSSDSLPEVRKHLYLFSDKSV